jgi:hypothetical protein
MESALIACRRWNPEGSTTNGEGGGADFSSGQPADPDLLQGKAAKYGPGSHPDPGPFPCEANPHLLACGIFLVDIERITVDEVTAANEVD